jgi:phenylacetic acid degradation operon negative regulatory protein
MGSLGNRRTALEMNHLPPPDDPLAAVVSSSGAGSVRARSLAATFLGDCIVPRAGDVGIATITEVLGRFGIEAGVTRTSMSRLASGGWVKRQKVGRNSFYSLTPAALAESEAASRRIYAARHPQDPCGWRVYLAGGLEKTEQARMRAALRHRGAAELGSQVYILPASENLGEFQPAIALDAKSLPAPEARELVRRAFDLAAIGEDYARFVAVFAPVQASLSSGFKLTGLDAVAVRVFVIHRFRRIVLRDPGVPAPYLPENWPGFAARKTAATIWRALLRPSEAWLDANAASASGPLPRRSISWQQFQNAHPSSQGPRVRPLDGRESL